MTTVWFFAVERADPQTGPLVHGETTRGARSIEKALESAPEAAFSARFENARRRPSLWLWPKIMRRAPVDARPALSAALEEISIIRQAGGSAGCDGDQSHARAVRNVRFAGFPVIQVHTTSADTETVQTVAQLDSSYPSGGGARKTGQCDAFFQYCKAETPPESPRRASPRVLATS